ncbi:DUF2065 domain-containing protein [Enterobacteriaceae bacterium LUAb1]
MSTTVWLALALVLIIEGMGPMFFPRIWRRIILSMAQQPDHLLRRFGGGLAVAGLVIFCLLRSHGDL